MRLVAVAAVLIVAHAGASLTLLHTQSSGLFDPVGVEVPFGKVVAGSSLGANLTNASVSIAGTLLQTSTDILYLNNTNATGVYHARLELVSTTGLANLDLLKLSIDNGTVTDQILIQLGSITDATGPYVQLEPASTNKIVVTQALALLSAGSVTFTVHAADDPQESAVVTTRAVLDLT